MNKAIRLLFLLGLLVLSGCNFNQVAAPTEETEDPSLKITEAVLTVYAQLTETQISLDLSATPTFTPVPHTNTPEPTATWTATLVPTEVPTNTVGVPPTEAPTATATTNMPCNRANLETKSVPDGTVINIGTIFTQTYRIKNTGSCAWNENYELRFIEGDLLNAGANIRMPIVGQLPTWSYIHIDVLMKAPEEPGTYKGYWMIKSDKGKIFGQGSAGNQWFWTEIKVVNPDA